MPLSLDLRGQRILVVGASSGLGRAIATTACQASARVAFAARRLDRLEEAVAEAPGEALAVACDVHSAEDCARAVERCVTEFGGLDALVYASGMSPLAMLADATQREWREVLDTNLIGASLITAAVLSPLRASGGRALYLSSYAVRQSLPGLSLYRVSKVALDALIECWRVEHPDVDFTRIVVGNTAGTEFAEAWGAEQTQQAIQVWLDRNLFPAPTMMPPESLAEAVLAVLAIRGYVDDIAIMPRQKDSTAEPG